MYKDAQQRLVIDDDDYNTMYNGLLEYEKNLHKSLKRAKKLYDLPTPEAQTTLVEEQAFLYSELGKVINLKFRLIDNQLVEM